MLLYAESELAAALDDSSGVLLAICCDRDVKNGRTGRHPVVLQGLAYDLDNVAREGLEKGVVLAAVVERDYDTALETRLDGESSIQFDFIHDQRGHGSRVWLHVNHAVHAPAHLFLFGLVFAALDRVLAADTSANLDNLVGYLEREAALFLATEALAEREATRLASHSLRFERVLLFHVRVVGEISSEESLRFGLVVREEIARVKVAGALKFSLVLNELHAAPVHYDVHVLELVLGRLLRLGLLPHPHDPFFDH